jgi:hypothetical protein
MNVIAAPTGLAAKSAAQPPAFLVEVTQLPQLHPSPNQHVQHHPVTTCRPLAPRKCSGARPALLQHSTASTLLLERLERTVRAGLPLLMV